MTSGPPFQRDFLGHFTESRPGVGGSVGRKRPDRKQIVLTDFLRLAPILIAPTPGGASDSNRRGQDGGSRCLSWAGAIASISPVCYPDSGDVLPERNMKYVVDAATAVRHRLVFELRYERGELYWDRCGRVARTVANREGWATNAIDTNGCHVRNDDDNLVFSFSPTSVSLSQTQNRDVQEVPPCRTVRGACRGVFGDGYRRVRGRYPSADGIPHLDAVSYRIA